MIIKARCVEEKEELGYTKIKDFYKTDSLIELIKFIDDWYKSNHQPKAWKWNKDYNQYPKFKESASSLQRVVATAAVYLIKKDKPMCIFEDEDEKIHFFLYNMENEEGKNEFDKVDISY